MYMRVNDRMIDALMPKFVAGWALVQILTDTTMPSACTYYMEISVAMVQESAAYCEAI